MDVPIKDQGCYRFGPFRLDPVRRMLWRNDAPVKLPARLFDTLLHLVEHHGRVVDRDELMQAVWRGRTVDGNNLGQAISALRKVMQADDEAACWVVTAQRGYRLGAPVTFEPFPANSLVSSGEIVADMPAVPTAPTGGRRFPPLAIALLAACLVMAFFVWRRDRMAPAFTPPPHSVAVLAFANMSGDAGADYLTDGLAEELTSALARLPALRVAARMSAFSFKGRPATVADIARQLNVGAVLEGSLRRDGARLRIAVHLVDTRTGFEIWASDYDRERGDLFALQGEIAAAVTRALQVSLLGDDTARLVLGGTTRAGAFDAYLRGMKMLHDGDPASKRKALAEFDAAIARDPNYALAQVQRAVTLQALSELEENPGLDWLHATQQAAIDSARTAISLAPDLAVAHAALGRTLEEDRYDFTSARAEFARALDLAPNDAAVNLLASTLQLYLGHYPEAIAGAQRAVSLDPLTPATYRDLAGMLADSRRYDEAAITLHHAEQLEQALTPEDQDVQSDIELARGDYESASRTCAGEHDWSQTVCLAVADHALGRPADAASHLARLRGALGDTGALQYAEIYAQWGQTTDAVAWLQTAFRLHDPGLMELRVERLLDPIRDTPELQDIERRLNLAP